MFIEIRRALLSHVQQLISLPVLGAINRSICAQSRGFLVVKNLDPGHECMYKVYGSDTPLVLYWGVVISKRTCTPTCNMMHATVKVISLKKS